MTRKYYYINGWREGKNRFMEFGFTEEEVKKMENGDVIKREGTDFDLEFAIIIEEVY